MDRSLKIAINCFFEPVQQLKEYYENNKDVLLLIRCGANDNLIKPSKWYLDNSFADNIGENISSLNKSLCDGSGIYWIWKNYDKIGNPDFIGINQYRKLYDINIVKQRYRQFDWLINGIGFFHDNEGNKISLFEHFMISHFEDDYLQLAKFLNKNEKTNFLRYISNLNPWTDKSMFVTSRENFFKLCEHIFPPILEALKTIDVSSRDSYQRRLGGYFVELLTAYHIMNEISNSKSFSCIGYQYHHDWQPKNLYKGLER